MNRRLRIFALLTAVGILVGVALAQSGYVQIIRRHILLSLIDSTPIGQTTPAAGNFTSLTISGVPLRTGNFSQTDVTGSRSFGSTFTNGSSNLLISGFAREGPAGSTIGNIICNAGPSSPSATTWESGFTATNVGTPAGFMCVVPPTWKYSVTISGDIQSTGFQWVETTF